MENIIWISITIAVGILMVGLSYIFLKPIFKDPPGGADSTLRGNTKRIYRSFAGVFTTVMLVLFATFSVETA
ncbi:hypothetical protein KAJ77_04780, partial [bacterium]|nr:hypothetical protein [bacterium]